jgi:hypothetical protein
MRAKDLVALAFRLPRNPKKTAQPEQDRELAEQDICVGNINPVKLAEKLQLTFGPGSFEVHVRNPILLISQGWQPLTL